MPTCALFPTLVYEAPPQRAGLAELNRRLQRECVQPEAGDDAGRRWSARNYPGGYTSYGSQARLHTVSPTRIRASTVTWPRRRGAPVPRHSRG